MSTKSETREATETLSEPARRTAKPRLWRVLLHNDDYTTQEFVVWVLEAVFAKASAEAEAIMVAVHRSGIGVAGVFTRDVADTRVKRTLALAEKYEYPLRVTMEPESSADGE